MPKVYDNIELKLLDALRVSLKNSYKADFCVGYFNMWGWDSIVDQIEHYEGGEGKQCRILIGMQKIAHDDLKAMRASTEIFTTGNDNRTAHKWERQIIKELRKQLTFGFQSNRHEQVLKRLKKQIDDKKVTIKLYLRKPLHAKLYLAHRIDEVPRRAYVGSSNLTVAGLTRNEELNLDASDSTATEILANWFEERWNDKLSTCVDDIVAEILDNSWIKGRKPYHIYLKMAYHLSQEAREGISKYNISKIMKETLFDYQSAAAKIAAQHINKRGGVLIGDVVGLGKTLLAIAVAQIFEKELGYRILIICPKSLVGMWEDQCEEYKLDAKVMSVSVVQKVLPDLRCYHLVVIDESHNLRNRESKRYRAIQEYIKSNNSKVMMLTATPYNKTFMDLSNQLRLFIPEEKNIGIRPEKLLEELGVLKFKGKHQTNIRSIGAFEKSEYIEDWQELMRLYMIRRTRNFIKDNYAFIDCPGCGEQIKVICEECPKCKRKIDKTDRRYLLFDNGNKSFFPNRIPRKIDFEVNENDAGDQFARLYTEKIVEIINSLTLPRYGLGQFIEEKPSNPPNGKEQEQLEGLSKAGDRLMGFCRTNLFKRLESSGMCFILSLKRHIARNFIFIYAIENNFELPIGSQDIELMDSVVTDQDFENVSLDDENISVDEILEENTRNNESYYMALAQKIYSGYKETYSKRFKWIRADLFKGKLKDYLLEDARKLINILNESGEWNPDEDTKMLALKKLIAETHKDEKIIVFTQFADTVEYLETELTKRNIDSLAGVTGSSDNPEEYSYRFSPISNKGLGSDKEPLRVLISTDVLSEGHNLQDAHIVVNYDLPWAIIKLIQRVGRVDRIGQQAENIYSYFFEPAKGVEQIIKLHSRLVKRLVQNEEVVGSDEVFFDVERERELVELYHEKAGILDEVDDGEVDLASYAYEIWNKATARNPKLKSIIPNIPDVSNATKEIPNENVQEGVLLYLRTQQGNDALAYIDKTGKIISENQLRILKLAECEPPEPPVEKFENHHELVEKAAKHIISEEKSIGGELGSPRGARYRTYERLKHYYDTIAGTVFDKPDIVNAIEAIYNNPLKQSAVDTLNRQLRTGINDQSLAELVISLDYDDKLVIEHKEDEKIEPQIVCSMGLRE